MIEKLHVFYGDEFIGDISHDTNGNRYHYEPKSESFGAKLWADKTNALRGDDWFKDFLENERVFPPNRVDAREMLRRAGMLEYNPWEIMKYGHFISADLFWAHKDMTPEWFWTNHPLASIHPRYTEVTGKPMYSTVVEVDQTTIY